MADDGEIAITIVEDEDANVAAAETKTPEAKKPEPETKDPALADLMAQYKELEAKNAESEKRAQEAESRRLAAEQETARQREAVEVSRKRETNSHLDTITTAISASEQDVEGAKAAIRAAKSSGDIDAEIEAQDRLAKARATLLRLDEARQDIEARIKAPPKTPQRSSDPVEAFASTLSPASAAWVRSHPDYARSEKGLRKLTAADAVAQAEDLIPDSAEYFARVEEYLGIRKMESKEAPIEAAQVTSAKPRSAAPPVAPGSAVSGSANGALGVTLSRREVDAATDGTHIWTYDDPSGEKRWRKGDVIGVKEFARRKHAMMKAGMYDKSFTES